MKHGKSRQRDEYENVHPAERSETGISDHRDRRSQTRYGEIADEFDPDNKYLTQLSEREWLVDGRFSIDDAAELGWPVEDSDEYETIAGFVLELADSVPKPGDVFERNGYQFKVQSMRGRRLSMLRVVAPETPVEEAKE